MRSRTVVVCVLVVVALLAVAFGCTESSPSHRDEADDAAAKQTSSDDRELDPRVVAQMPLVDVSSKIKQRYSLQVGG